MTGFGTYTWSEGHWYEGNCLTFGLIFGLDYIFDPISSQAHNAEGRVDPVDLALKNRNRF
jgi:hypothetical protein